MPPAPLPVAEFERVAALRSYAILDTACETTFNEIVELAARLLGTPIAAVSLVDSNRQWFKAKVGLDAQETPRDQAFCSYTILSSDPLVVPDATADDRFADNPLVTGEPGIRFYAGAPLVTPEGHRLGSLCVIDRTARELTPEQVQTLTVLGRTAMTTLQLHRAMLQARTLALTDALTGLPNRAALLDAIDRAMTRQVSDGTSFAMLYIDLDGFKRVNDRQGHDVGDKVLLEVAAVLRQSVASPDMAARIGGDEFIVLIDADRGQTPLVLAERLRQLLAAALARNGWHVTASIGAVVFSSPPRDVSEALGVADQLMYGAKLAGKDRVMSRVFIRTEAA